ncbi:MAG: 4Fe-4S binding protein [Methanobrevibacter sp.]|nr:4Fe-4S binding protein [Methanobrevibacter sp.]MBO6105071.1 4Fe-4S binding protein [Methanobrevibacter sp.]MBO7518025.1 4Fe-4S binding protein [Methanobrevibacter sp.]MBO7692913.1 4Fe-4S binding protein [Methanobrevibacter sp.]MBO7713222.1 4Fe-4S binding protein [Methanobrevibacter sp.]
MDDKDRRKGYYEDVTTFLVGHTFHTRFFLSRLTKKSRIAKKIIDAILFKDDEVYVLPNKKAVNKTITTNIEINQSFEKDDSEFVPSEIIKEVIKQAEDIVIMHKCLCRTSSDCQDYPQDFGCIFIGPSSKKIASKYGRSATREEALEHVEMADELGLSHVIGRNKIDSVWMNVRPKEGLLTICHCCPCCCLWRVLPDLDDEISDKVKRLEDVEVHTINDKCRLCKKCITDNVCFGDAISLEDGKITIDQNKCVGCGHCVKSCNFDALELHYSQKSIDSVVNRIGELVDYKKK